MPIVMTPSIADGRACCMVTPEKDGSRPDITKPGSYRRHELLHHDRGCEKNAFSIQASHIKTRLNTT